MDDLTITPPKKRVTQRTRLDLEVSRRQKLELTAQATNRTMAEVVEHLLDALPEPIVNQPLDYPVDSH